MGEGYAYDSADQFVVNHESNKPRKSRFYLLLSVGIVLLGAFMFGFNVSYPSVTLDYLETQFNLNSSQKALIASVMTLGAGAGALSAGPLADAIGRKWAFAVASVPYIIGGGVIAFANAYVYIIIGRVVSGLGVGMYSVMVPMYIGEVAPAEIRGALGSGNQFAVTIGVLAAFVNGYAQQSDKLWWRSMGWQIAGVGAFLLLSAPVLPETARYYLSKGRTDAARNSLIRLGVADVDGEIEELQEAQRHNAKASWMELFRGRPLRLLLIGIGLQISQQFTGINAVTNYATPIFVDAGFSKSKSILASIIVGSTQVVSTGLTIAVVDRAGRRVLLTLACVIMGVAHIGLAVYFYTNSSTGWIAIVCLVLFMLGFSVGMGPLPWVVIAEIFPTHLKGNAMSICTLVNWMSNYVVVQTYPILQTEINSYGVFFMYGGICVLAWLFIFFFVPETKGVSLEEFQRIQDDNQDSSHQGLLAAA